MSGRARVCTRVFVCAHGHVCSLLCVGVCVCVCGCDYTQLQASFVHTHTHTHTHTHKHACAMAFKIIGAKNPIPSHNFLHPALTFSISYIFCISSIFSGFGYKAVLMSFLFCFLSF